MIQILVILIALCVFEPARSHSSAESIDVSFIHQRHNMTMDSAVSTKCR